MGEEEKKAEDKKREEAKKEAAAAEEVKKPAAEEEKKPAEGDKPKEEKKENGGTGDDKKEEKKDETPPPPPQEIVLRVYMHCEGCARKVRKSLKGFNGVKDVITDCKTHKVVVKGEKADPLKVLARVERKSHRQVELLSPLPPPKPSTKEDNKAEEKQPPKPEEKKEEPKVVTVVLKVHMHCEACALEIKKRIERMKEVESVTPDLKSSEVIVKGTFDPAKLVQYVHKRTGKHAVIIKQDPEPPKDDASEKPKEDDKKGDGEKKGGDEDKKDGDKAAEQQEGGGEDAKSGGEETKVVEIRRNEYYCYPPKYAMEMYAYPPQIFSDENPNACSIM